MMHISIEAFAEHILYSAGGKKGDLRTVIECLERFRDYTIEHLVSGLYLTDAQRDEWMRCNLWEGL